MIDLVLTKGQEKAIKEAKKWWSSNDRFLRPFVLAGYSGSGKSTIVSRIIEELNLDHDSDDVKFICYTGMAAGVLCKKGLMATTIHKLIYDVLIDEKENDKGVVEEEFF